MDRVDVVVTGEVSQCPGAAMARRFPREGWRAAERVEAAGADGLLDIEAIAEAYCQPDVQHRLAWTRELDLRPYKERFR